MAVIEATRGRVSLGDCTGEVRCYVDDVIVEGVRSARVDMSPREGYRPVLTLEIIDFDCSFKVGHCGNGN